MLNRDSDVLGTPHLRVVSGACYCLPWRCIIVCRGVDVKCIIACLAVDVVEVQLARA